MASLVAGWHPVDRDRAGEAASRLRRLVQKGPAADDTDDKDMDRLPAILEAAATVREADPDLAAWLLDHVGGHEETNFASGVKMRAAGLWAAWGQSAKCRQLAEGVLAYERGLGWYEPADDMAALAVAVDGTDPQWARQLADEAERLIVTAATATHDKFERSRLDLTLAGVAEAFRAWDRDRALRIARYLGDGWLSGGSWDQLYGRRSALAVLGLDACQTDIGMARQLLEECTSEREPVTALGRTDARLHTGGLYRPAEEQLPDSGEVPLMRRSNFYAYVINVVNYWGRGRDLLPFTKPADVARSVQVAPGTPGSPASWAGVIAAAVGPVADRDMDAAIDLAGWLSDPGERLIACADLARALTYADDERASAALDAVGRAAVSLPRYTAETDLEMFPQGPVLAYLNPSFRARWEAALLLPQQAERTADSLVRATGSSYLQDTLRAQRVCDALYSPVPADMSPQAVIDVVRGMLASVEGHVDNIQCDLARAAAVAALARWDPAQADAVAARITDPGRALMARVNQVALTAADPAALSAACRAVLDAAPDDPPSLSHVVATAWAVGWVRNQDPEGARELTAAAAAALGGADARAAALGLAVLAAAADGACQTELLRAALGRADDMVDGYLRNIALTEMLAPAAFTADTQLLTEVVSKLLVAGWQVLMEGLRQAIGPLVDLAGPGLLAQLDEALRSAQQIAYADTEALPAHIDGVAAPALRRRVLADRGPGVAAADGTDFEPLYLTAQDVPGMVLETDFRQSGADPGDYAFVACGGLHAGLQAWVGEQTDRTWRLMDIRFAFSDAEQAAVYHAERLLANSEGYPPVANAPLAGEDCHVFGGTQRYQRPAGTIDVTRYFYVFRVNAVVVKLFAAQGVESADPLQPEHLHALAERIVTKLSDL
jgi:hypothetical protein